MNGDRLPITVVLGRTYREARNAKNAYGDTHPEVALARPLSTFEPHTLLGLRVKRAYVLPDARGSHSTSASAAFKLLDIALKAADGERIDLDLPACRCASGCGVGCPGDDRTFDHCSGCGHRRLPREA